MSALIIRRNSSDLDSYYLTTDGTFHSLASTGTSYADPFAALDDATKLKQGLISTAPLAAGDLLVIRDLDTGTEYPARHLDGSV